MIQRGRGKFATKTLFFAGLHAPPRYLFLPKNFNKCSCVHWFHKYITETQWSFLLSFVCTTGTAGAWYIHVKSKSCLGLLDCFLFLFWFSSFREQTWPMAAGFKFWTAHMQCLWFRCNDSHGQLVCVCVSVCLFNHSLASKSKID